MRKITGWVFFGVFLLIVAMGTSIAEEKKLSGEFKVISVKGNIVKAQNKGTGTRLSLVVTEDTEILHQGERKLTVAELKKGDIFFGEYIIRGKEYIATRIDLK